LHSGVPVSEWRTVLVVDEDVEYGRALAKLLRREGNEVRLVTTPTQALRASQRRHFDVAIVDLLGAGGGTELARRLARRIPRLMLSVGARLDSRQLLETALGFPVHHKAALPGLLRERYAGGNGNGHLYAESRAVRAPAAARRSASGGRRPPAVRLRG
jgi:CheY-like chemotaxis protein